MTRLGLAAEHPATARHSRAIPIMRAVCAGVAVDLEQITNPISECDAYNIKALPFREAVGWIAWGIFSDPVNGPQNLINLENPDDSTRYSAFQGQRELAEQIIFSSIKKGEVKVYCFYFTNRGRRMSAEKVLRQLTHEFLQSCQISQGEGYYDIAFYEEDDGTKEYVEQIHIPNCFLDWDDLIKISPWVYKETDSVSPQKPIAVSQSNHLVSRGRPQKFKWDQFWQEVVSIANTPDGLPERQTDMEGQMLEWCLHNWGAEPGESTIRTKIGPLYKRQVKKSESRSEND